MKTKHFDIQSLALGNGEKRILIDEVENKLLSEYENVTTIQIILRDGSKHIIKF